MARSHYRRGAALERQARIEEAVSAYTLASAFARTAPAAKSRLGHLFMGLGRGSEAAQAFRAAAGSAPAEAERRMDLVRALILEKKDAEAEQELRRALAADPRDSDGYWLLGRVLTESGRFAEAQAALERSIALNPDQGAVYYDLVRCRTLTLSDRPLIDRMLTAARSIEQTEHRVRLHLALGKAFDDVADYPSAMRHIIKANQIKKNAGSFDRDALSHRVDRLIERFSPDLLSAQVDSASISELPILILGMPRSGTTLVEQILSSHPDIEGADELHFWPACGLAFDQLAPGESVTTFQAKAAQDCLDLLHGIAPGAVRVTDKNPFNFLRIGLVRLVFPRATIIHCRRNPIDTCLSIHSTYFSPRREFSTDLDDLAFYYRQYSRLMDHWRAMLPSDRFVEIDYEALVAEPEAVSRRMVAACGLPWDDACLRPEHNPRIVRSASKWQARQPIYRTSSDRRRRYEPWVDKLRELVGHE
ncbi:MAG: tetratricopeptide repeat-containing sulfotransferase family protein [Caulobacteraceae bacterium]